jgi:hypothetical protein
MGWGDVYRSHHYTPIYWSSFVGALLKIFPTLRKSRPYVFFASVQLAKLMVFCYRNPTVDVPQGSNEEHASLDDNNREESFELAAETEAREAEVSRFCSKHLFYQ